MATAKKKAVKKKISPNKRTPAKPKLTVKQSLFVKEYLVDLNATQAAIRAGYSKKTAHAIAAENLTKPLVAAAVQEAMSKRGEETQTSAKWVLDRLVELYGKCTQAEPVVGREGIPTGMYKMEASVAVRTLELIGKHHAMFTSNVNLGSDTSLKNLTDEELDARLDELHAERQALSKL